MVHVSIVIPAYNAEDTLPDVLIELAEIVRSKSITGELIIVDDGSTDATDQAIQSVCKTFPIPCIYIRHSRNHGYGFALKTGIRRASYSICVTMDADGQHDPKDLPNLILSL